MESFQGFRERLHLEGLGGKRNSLIQWLRIQSICAVALRAGPDHIGSVLVVAEAADRHRASVGKDGLNLKDTADA